MRRSRRVVIETPGSLARSDRRVDRVLAMIEGLGVVFLALLAVSMPVALAFGLRDELALDRRGRVAVAVVEAVHADRFGDNADITFTPEGESHLLRASVDFPLWPSSPQQGDQMRIDYDPMRPTRVRRAGSHDMLWLTLAFVLVLAGLGVSLLRRRHRSRQRFG